MELLHSLEAIKVFSQQRGGRMQNGGRGITTVNGTTLSFNPTNNFKPGETIYTTVTPSAQSSEGFNLARGKVYQFTTAAGGTGQSNFQPGSEPIAGFGPESVAIGDVDGDGDLDLLTANPINNNVSVRLNGGNATGSNTGTFSNGAEITVGNLPKGVVLGDVDGDGDLDLLTANASSNDVSVRLNGGDATGSNTGTFNNGSTVTVGNTPACVVLGDVDGDGDLDLLTINLGSANVSVRLNGGNATGSNSGFFSNGSTVAVGDYPNGIALGDVDGDGDLDMIVANANSNTVSVRLNGGDATGSNTGIFSNGAEIPAGISPFGVALGDVDGDGDLDMLATNGGSANVSVRLNGGDATGSNTGTFNNGSTVTVGNTPACVVLGDVDGDGDLDMLTANKRSINVSVRLNQPALSDLTPILRVQPSIINGTASISLVVDVYELNGIPTNGIIKVYITKDPLLNLTFNSATTTLEGYPVQNSVWSCDGQSDATAYILTTSQTTGISGKLSVGLSGQLNPINTKGNLIISAMIEGGGVGDVRVLNNKDVEKIDYFNK